MFPTCMLEIAHPEKQDRFEFYKARIYIDERDLPIAYESFLWPEAEGEDPPLLEKYYYTNLKVNVGFDDADFDPDNEAYKFPGGEKTE